MYKTRVIKHTLKFIIPGGTSRGVLEEKDSWFIKIKNETTGITGIGECSILPNLSIDDVSKIDEKIEEVLNDVAQCSNLNGIISIEEQLQDFPAIRFGLETARLDLKNGGKRILFESDFTLGKDSIPINGLIWMGEAAYMKKQIVEKLEEGYNCLKLKIGELDFKSELELIEEIRQAKGDDYIIRVDANGAFTYDNYYSKLKALAELQVHSIEQPIAAGHAEQMEDICMTSPLPVALDEELIGYKYDKSDLLKQIKPQFIILKPSLLGGLEVCKEWIKAAEDCNVGWWVTSALESNIGLNAIAQWTYTLNNSLHQGLGTGKLFSNNIPSPLRIKSGKLIYDKDIEWDLSAMS